MNVANSTNAAGIPGSASKSAAFAFGKDISPEAFKRYLAVLFLLGLIVRTCFLIEHARDPSFGVMVLDQKYYDAAAKLLLSGQDLHLLHGMRPMLYPMFVAVLYKMGGPYGVELTVATQHFLGVLTGVLVALLGARLFRHRASGLAAGVLYVLAPVPLYLEGELLIESSYVFLVCFGLWLLLYTAESSGRRSAWLWLACGAMTVLTAQARANILFFMAVYPLAAGWRWWRSRQSAALLPLLGLLGGAVMGLPWGFVNKMQSGHFQMIPSAGGINLYLGNRRGADGMTLELNRYVNYNDRYEDPIDVWARQEYETAMRSEGRQPDVTPLAVSHYWTARAIGEIKADPVAWLRLMTKKSWLMLWNAEVPNNKAFAFLQTEFLLLRVLPVRWVVLLMLAPVGIWAAVKRGNREALFILLVYLSLYFASNAAFFICDRFRYPLWPVMAVFGGGGLLMVGQTILRGQWAGAIAFAAVMASMAVLSLHNWFAVKLPSFALDYRLHSVACYEKGLFQEALRDIDRSVSLNPSDMTALHHRGNVLLALNRFDEARQDYQRTLKINSDDGAVWNNYGVALENLGRTNEAVAAFQRATESHPPSDNAYLGMAFLETRAGRVDEADTAVNQFAKLEPAPNAVVLAIRSVIARRRGKATEADSLEQQARRLDSDEAAWAIRHANNP